MEIDIELKNYRCFPDENLARFSIRPGFTSFVGANNSGKSSLLKFFFEFRNVLARIVPSAGHLFGALKGGPVEASLSGLFDPREVFSNTNDRDLELVLRFHDPNYQQHHDLPPPVSGISIKLSRQNVSWTATLFLPDGPLMIGDAGLSTSDNGRVLKRGADRVADLETLHQCSSILRRCFYVGPFRNAINVGAREDYFDIQVGQAFIRTWRQYKTGANKSQNEAIYRLTQDIMKLFGFNDLEINPMPDDETFQVFIDGKSYKLPELGSGIAQFIMVLGSAAIKKPSFVLIDEPELNLHPSLQLSFLTTLTSYATDGVLFGTHSIGLARASAERIYSLRRLSEGRSEMALYDAVPDLAQFLGELSYSAHREIGVEKVLLVEGPSDLKTTQQFLRKHGKDHSFLLLQLGGSSLINEHAAPALAEVQRISGHVYALIDSERASAEDPIPADRLAFKQVCQDLGINCHILERRALDNYLSGVAVKRVKGEDYRALEPYESLDQPSPAWSKAESWRIALEMSRSELDATDLGEFLVSL